MIFQETSLAALTGIEIKDQGTLDFAGASACAGCGDTGPGQRQYSLVVGLSLGRRGLMDLLYAVAPYKAHGPDRFARVLDNWRIHDRAKASSTSQNLLLQHARSLKSNWRIFTAHRETFIAVLEDQTESTRVIPLLIWTKTTSGKRAWCFPAPEESEAALASPAPELAGAEAKLDSVVGLLTVPYLYPGLSAKWNQWQPLVKGGKSNYIGPASSPMIALLHKRALLNCPLIARAERLAEGHRFT